MINLHCKGSAIRVFFLLHWISSLHSSWFCCCSLVAWILCCDWNALNPSLISFPSKSLGKGTKRVNFLVWPSEVCSPGWQNVLALVRGDEGVLSHTAKLKCRSAASNCGSFLHYEGILPKSLEKSISRYPLLWSVWEEMCILSFLCYCTLD